MRQSSFPLRLASSLQEEARKTAKSEGVSLNQLINLAVAEKISALRTEDFFEDWSVAITFISANLPLGEPERHQAFTQPLSGTGLSDRAISDNSSRVIPHSASSS